MANYQFYLAVFPKDGLLKVKGKIPNKLDFNDATGFFDNNPENLWKATNINSQDLISEIDDLLPRAEWGNKNGFSFSWKLENKFIDNDAWISLTQEKVIEEFYLRFDLREHKLNFLMQIIELSKKYNLLINDYEGNLANPIKISEVKKLILKNKKSIRFIEDLDFFNSLADFTSH